MLSDATSAESAISPQTPEDRFGSAVGKLGRFERRKHMLNGQAYVEAHDALALEEPLVGADP
eukprot:6518766-Alexandrium_andersonii.AAC.1